jgi:hypothetical protein
MTPALLLLSTSTTGRKDSLALGCLFGLSCSLLGFACGVSFLARFSLCFTSSGFGGLRSRQFCCFPLRSRSASRLAFGNSRTPRGRNLCPRLPTPFPLRVLG